MKTACTLLAFVGFLAVAVSVGEAATFKPGDMAVVKTEKAEVKQGSEVIAYLSKGQRIKIHYVHAQGGFALVHIRIGGKDRKGYVRLNDLEPPTRKETQDKGAGFQPDDRIVIEATQAKLMKGKTVLGRVSKGTVLTVVKVRGDWLGVRPDIDGKKIFGWLHSRDVDYAPTDGEDDAKEKEKDKKK